MGQDAIDDVARQRDDVDLLRRRIVNVVGHELKLPVSAIRGLAASLQHASPDQIATEIAPALIRSSARLERLVDDLLLAAGIFTVLPVEPPEPQAVGAAVDRAIAAAGVSVNLEGDGSTVVAARADALDRVLAVLIDNAVKYGRPPYVVRIGTTDGAVTIDVISNGAPKAEDLALALEPFYRGEAAVTAAPGLGIGLAVAAALTAQDGGRLAVRAEGDTVVATVELPAP
ncbi:MAG: two-component system, OmpR family, phosphate regulon sensor histidine kinase PhoR [Actinomycetota bacterium]